MDRMDELLRRTPSEAMAEDLPARIQLALRSRRARERRSQLVVDAAMAGMALLGLSILIPDLAGAGTLPGLGGIESATMWVGQFRASPAPAVWSAITGALGWMQAVAGNMRLEGAMGLVLLAVPLLTWLRRLMPDRGREPDLLPGWSGMAPDQGATA